MLSHHVLAVLCNKNLEIAGSSWFKGKIRFLLSCQQRGEVLFHESQVFHEVEASLFEVVEFFKEAAIFYTAWNLGRVVEMGFFVVVEVSK